MWIKEMCDESNWRNKEDLCLSQKKKKELKTWLDHKPHILKEKQLQNIKAKI